MTPHPGCGPPLATPLSSRPNRFLVEGGYESHGLVICYVTRMPAAAGDVGRLLLVHGAAAAFGILPSFITGIKKCFMSPPVQL